MTFKDKAKQILENKWYAMQGEKLLLKAYLNNRIKETWNLKALIDVRYEEKKGYGK